MKRASYRFAVQWIADEDEPLNLDVQDVSHSVTVGLIADLFEVTTARVARDVIRRRGGK